MPGVDSAWSIFGFVDRDFEVRCIWQYLLQQRRMGYHTAPFFAGSRLCLKHAEESYCRDTDRIEQRHLGHSISPKLSNGKQGPNRLQGDHDTFISSSHLPRRRQPFWATPDHFWANDSAWLNIFRRIGKSRPEAAGFGAERACVSGPHGFFGSVAQRSQTIPPLGV